MTSAWTDEDRARLQPSRLLVLDLMLDGEWHRTDEMCRLLGLRNIGTLTSRIRDIKALHQGWRYDRQKVKGAPGIFEYRLFVPTPPQGQLALFI